MNVEDLKKTLEAMEASGHANMVVPVATMRELLTSNLQRYNVGPDGVEFEDPQGFYVRFEDLEAARRAPAAAPESQPRTFKGDEKFNALLDAFVTAASDALRCDGAAGTGLKSVHAERELIAYLDAALSAPAAPAPAASEEWISVLDRMPAEWEMVLTWGSKKVDQAVMAWSKHDGWQIETANEWHSAYAPTHWRALPAAPATSDKAEG